MVKKSAIQLGELHGEIGLSESELDNRLLNLLHNTNNGYKAFETAVMVISAFLEQPQSFE